MLSSCTTVAHHAAAILLLICTSGCFRGNGPPPTDGKGPTSDTPRLFVMSLSVSNIEQGQSIQVESEQLPTKRPILSTYSGGSLQIECRLATKPKTKPLTDITVHFFVAKCPTGQTEAPPLGPDVTNESAYTMDFEPGEESASDLMIPTPPPGTYQIRLEAAGIEPAEFVAVDLVVE